MAQGTIFSIEEFALNDGPGIRTTVFLKGCPLCCVWCHNPEGIAFASQMLKTAEGEQICGEVITADALAERLLRHRDILEQTGGGVTITGGEPFAQPAFLEELLRRLAPVHTAIETSGYAPTTIFQRIVPLVDLTLFDIKAVDAAVHRKFTGSDNALILRNLEWLCDSGKDFIVRLPLIPGVNDSLEAMEAVLGSMTHWVWAALLTWFFPKFLSIGGTYIFGFFAIAVLGTFFFAMWMPETKNKSLEQIQKELTSSK